MAIVPNFRINPYVQPFTGGVSGEFGQAVDQRLQQYEAAAEADDVLGYQTDVLLQNVNPFEGDQMYAKTLINQARDEIGQRAKKGDYENMFREVRRSARDFAANAQPLLQNKTLYDEYRKGLSSMTDVDDDTKRRALAYSTQNYKGLDPNNISGSMFQGFNPSKTIDIGKKVDDFLTGWKSDKGAREFIDPVSGTTHKLSWEQAQKGITDGRGKVIRSGKEIMRDAAVAHLQADPEYLNYHQTQTLLDNTPRLERELQGGIGSGLEKHYFEAQDSDLGFIPEWWRKEQDALAIARTAPLRPSSPTFNSNAVDPFEGLTSKNGKVVTEDYVEEVRNSDGTKSFVYLIDKETGKKIGPSVAAAAAAVSGFSDPDQYERVEMSFEDLEKEQNNINSDIGKRTALLKEASKNKFLLDAIDNNKIPNYWLQSSDDPDVSRAINDYLNVNRKQWDSPEALDRTMKENKEAFKNYKNIKWNEVFEIDQTEITGIGGEKLKDEELLGYLVGKDIALLAPEKGGFIKGANRNSNAFLEHIQEDGYKVDKVIKRGVLKYNPYSDRGGAISLSFILKNDDGKIKVVEAAVGNDDYRFQPLQDVGILVSKGISGEVDLTNVPVKDPNLGTTYLNGKARVIVAPNTGPNKDQLPFKGIVQIYNKEGKLVNTIQVNRFAEYYRSLVPDLLDSYAK